MTREEIMALDREGLDARQNEIRNLVQSAAADADLAALNAEMDAIEERRNQLNERAEQRRQLEDRIASGAEGTTVRSFGAGAPAVEVRNSAAYIEAYKNYVVTGSDAECRALLTENAPSNGQVPVPEFVGNIIQTAYDRMPILSRVTRTNLKGNLKIGFERSATAAAVHNEGAAAPAEEELLLGVAEIVPKTYKKWITVSDEVVDMNGREFLEYIYREVSYRIFKAVEDAIVSVITSAPATATNKAASVAKGTATGTVADFFNGRAMLSDEATGIVAIMTKTTEAAYKNAAIQANFRFEPFDGLEVLNNDSLGKKVVIGDLTGVQVNFTNGSDITFKVDDLSLAEKDLVKIVGRLPLGIGLIACGRFAVLEGE